VPNVARVETGQVTLSEEGQQVRIVGQIVEVWRYTSGIKPYVDDGSGRLAVWIPQSLRDGLAEGEGWISGSTVEVIGRVQEYKDEVELVPQSRDDVRVLVAATPQPATLTPIGELTARDKGRQVTILASVVEIEPFSSGVKALLDDGSGRILLLLWQNVFDDIPDNGRLAPGAKVQATGEVDEFDGELEIIPGAGSEIRFERSG
jgi:DNA/RNA endonuclease YhcR with UshA esterase domain